MSISSCSSCTLASSSYLQTLNNRPDSVTAQDQYVQKMEDEMKRFPIDGNKLVDMYV